MTNEAKAQSLSTFSDRVAYVVTDLNGLIGRIVNEEVTQANFKGDLTDLFHKLSQVEKIVNELVDVFWAEKGMDAEELTKRSESQEEDETESNPCDPTDYEQPNLETLMEWEAEGGCEAIDGCWVEPDGTCMHGCQSWLLVLGLI
jgi:hypothetical protein